MAVRTSPHVYLENIPFSLPPLTLFSKPPPTRHPRDPNRCPPRQAPQDPPGILRARPPLQQLRQSRRLPHRQRGLHLRPLGPLCPPRPAPPPTSAEQVHRPRPRPRHRYRYGLCQLCCRRVGVCQWRSEEGRGREEREKSLGRGVMREGEKDGEEKPLRVARRREETRGGPCYRNHEA